MDMEDFYQQCAIAAMQGLQEGGRVLGVVSDVMAKATARIAFDMADAMMEEYSRRKGK